MPWLRLRSHLSFALSLACCATVAHGSSWAANIESYDAGEANPGLDNPQVALGEPARFTGEPIFPAVVSAFNPPWTDNEIVAIGPGGHLTISFDSPVTNDPNHPFGVDLLIFGNTGFQDASYPSGIVKAALFGNDGGLVEISADGENWEAVPIAEADGMYPTIGYLDAGPYDTEHGATPTDFTRPVDPALTLSDFVGLHHDQVIELYHGSGGGAGIDIGDAGMDEILYVRITNTAPVGSGISVDIDGFSKVSPWILGDLNGDGVVNVTDLLLLLRQWGAATPGGVPADLDGDGTVNVVDLLSLLANWGD